MEDPKNYKEIARSARLKVLSMIYIAQTSHISSNFSAIDILSVLFEKVNLEKDEVILSAGWKAAAWYYFLWKKGILSEEELNSFCQPGSAFIGLVEPMGRWGLRCAGGALGIAFSMSVGMARARKALNKEGKIWILISDGEAQCGNIWESSRKVIQEGLDNIIVIMDKNEYCAMGKTDEILRIDPSNLFQDWCGKLTNGHDFEDIEDALNHPCNKPKAIIAKTQKGFPISFMTGNNLWHYRAPNEEEYKEALKELNR